MILNACGRKRTVSQIAGHELYHDMARRYPSMVADAKTDREYEENQDIRYALSDEEEAAVREKNASLRDLLKALNPPARARESVRLEIDAALSAMITNRNVSEQAIENLWDALLDSDAVSIAPQDENYKDIADALKGTKIHVNDTVKGDLGDDWKSLKKCASKVGITLTRMPSQDVPDID